MAGRELERQRANALANKVVELDAKKRELTAQGAALARHLSDYMAAYQVANAEVARLRAAPGAGAMFALGTAGGAAATLLLKGLLGGGGDAEQVEKPRALPQKAAQKRRRG